MKKQTRRILSMALAFCMMLSMATGLAFAEGGEGGYTPVTGKEDWAPSAAAGEAAEDANVSLKKEVIERTAAGEWKIKLTITPKTQTVETKPIEIALVLDASWSMQENGSTRMANMKAAAKALINALKGNESIFVSLTMFGDTASKLVETAIPLSEANATLIKSKIDSISTKKNTATNMQQGLLKANETFTGNAQSEKHFILLSDGVPTVYGSSGKSGAGSYMDNSTRDATYSAAETVAGNLKTKTIHTIAFDTTSAAETVLSNITGKGKAGGKVLTSTNNLSDLVAVFKTITNDIVPSLSDAMATGMGNVSNISITIGGNPESVNVPSVTGETLTWAPTDGKLDKEVIITYTVKLTSIPAPGVYDNVRTNGAATFTYTLTGETGVNHTLHFQKPTVRYETGNLTVEWYKDEDTTPFDTETSANVITDFDSISSKVSFKKAANELTYSGKDYSFVSLVKTGLQGSNISLVDGTFKGSETGDLFLAQGESVLKYFYKEVDETSASSTSDEPPASSTSDEPPASSTSDEPPASSTSDEPPASSTSDEPPASSTSDEPPASSTSDEPPASSTSEPPVITEPTPMSYNTRVRFLSGTTEIATALTGSHPMNSGFDYTSSIPGTIVFDGVTYTYDSQSRSASATVITTSDVSDGGTITINVYYTAEEDPVDPPVEPEVPTDPGPVDPEPEPEPELPDPEEPAPPTDVPNMGGGVPTVFKLLALFSAAGLVAVNLFGRKKEHN